MSLAMQEWLKADALADYISGFCPDVTELTEYTRESRLWTCSCGWEGIPNRTYNSGGATNYRYCPNCKNSINLSEVEL